MAKKRYFEEQSNLFLLGQRSNWSTEQQIRLWVNCTPKVRHKTFGVHYV